MAVLLLYKTKPAASFFTSSHSFLIAASFLKKNFTFVIYFIVTIPLIKKARFHDVRIYDTEREIFEVTTGHGNRIAGKG